LRKDVKGDVDAREGSIKVPQAAQFAAWRDEVLGAAERLDQLSVEKVLDEAMASLPPVAFFEEVLAPLQREVGERWHQGRLTVAEEHLVTQAARQRVLALLHQAPRRAKHHAVCACFPDEDHELGLMGVSLKFRHAGWRVTFLGARTPAEHLGRVVRAVAPDVVALSAVSDAGPEAFERSLRLLLEATGAGPRVAVGGAASGKYRELIRSLGATTVESTTEWEALLA
jgi:methanogenic corrinoid protein MtbC1